MARTHLTRTVTQQKTYEVTDTTVACDKCGKPLDPDDNIGELNPNILYVALNESECVGSRFVRDYCLDCLEPIWQQICTLIDADPDDTSRSQVPEW